MFQENHGLKTSKLTYKSESTFWPAHLTLLMPVLTHNLDESCELYLFDLTKTSLSPERPKNRNSHSSPKRRAKTPMQRLPWAILFTICTVPTENDFSQRISNSNPPAWLRRGRCRPQPAQRPRPGGPSSAGWAGDAGTGMLAMPAVLAQGCWRSSGGQQLR